ncbi:MAG TPA: hypothetical protein VNM92_14545 [Thermoanaerobaculia bacterium]|nr:hypothetical protein [Thermoanaerobaculia bacterium]
MKKRKDVDDNDYDQVPRRRQALYPDRFRGVPGHASRLHPAGGRGAHFERQDYRRYDGTGGLRSRSGSGHELARGRLAGASGAGS